MNAHARTQAHLSLEDDTVVGARELSSWCSTERDVVPNEESRDGRIGRDLIPGTLRGTIGGEFIGVMARFTTLLQRRSGPARLR